MSLLPIQTFNLSNTKQLQVVNGHFKVDVAVWLFLNSPALVKNGCLVLRYFDGNSYKTKTLDKLLQPSAANTLLSARVSLPAALKNTELELCVSIEGSSFKLDSVHWSPIIDPIKIAPRTLYAA